MKKTALTIGLIIMCFLFAFEINAQKKSNSSATSQSIDIKLYEGLNWRNIGPFRGGRSAAVAGVPNKPNLFYFGATGGGVWKTSDGGNSWENISDGYFGGSIGAVTVSTWDPNVIYVGGGEVTVRGNVSYGYGIWKSEDAGKSWKNVGLNQSRHVVRIIVHPKNPDLVYAAVLGDIFKPSNERGVYRSKDGGKNWERVLFANENAGAVELTFDPNNPRILYASTWAYRRTPYGMDSGGEGSALWKSTNSGDTWINISTNKGLPDDVWGISAVTVSPMNSNRVWAIIENKNGGVYRSDDGGENWKLVNKDRNLRQRAWYYTKIYADTQNEDMVYVLNVDYFQSKDGGVTFQAYDSPHSDHHDLWIAPEDNQRMIIADDGGAQVSFDGGNNWTTYHNQPTAQFYRVVTDNSFPYRIYGAQQDNSTIRIVHRSDNRFITEQDWEETAGGESAHITVDPLDNDIVYGGSYGGFLTRYNHKTNEIRAINVWPDNPMGYGAEGMKYRFQWNFPIFFSPNNPKKLYATSNYVHISTNEGQSWEIISPDLTRNDVTKFGPSGGPITKDNTSVEYYGTIFAAAESQHEAGVIWTGSDDGLVHVTRDGGKNWSNVTPAGMPEWNMINAIEIDPFNKGGMYFAATRYKSGDYQPYLYKTEDYGKTWKKITNGIASEHFTRVLRADPVKKGILYAGTESGMYVSFNDGNTWQSFQQNLPIVPITDLTIKNNNLIAATQGRSFWVIDDLTVLHQLAPTTSNSDFFLFKPMDSYRMGGGAGRTSRTEGTNHPGGVLVNFYLKNYSEKDTISLTFAEANGNAIKTFSTKPNKESKEENLTVKVGLNQFSWNMRYPGATSFPGMILWAVSTQGPMALPGDYQVNLKVNGVDQSQNFNLIKNPRSSATETDLKDQFDFLIACRDKLSEANQAVIDIRQAKAQINDVMTKAGKDAKAIQDLGKEILDTLQVIEETLYQTKNESGQDPLNFPIRLNNKVGALGSLTSYGDNRPTDQSKAFYQEVAGKIDAQTNQLKVILNEKIAEFNRIVYESKIDAVKLKE